MENYSNTLIDKLPEIHRQSVEVLSVSPMLTDNLAKNILNNLGIANGNALDVISEIKKVPIWHSRTSTTWDFDKDIKEVCKIRLNGSTQKTKEAVFLVLNNENLEDYSISDKKDFLLQTSRLSLSIQDKFEEGICQFRTFFKTAELFGNYDTQRIISLYINENVSLNKNINWTESLLNASYMIGYFEYRYGDKSKALKYLTPVWEYKDKLINTLHDAGVAGHLIGKIKSNETHSFDKNIENLYLESIKILKEKKDTRGVAHVYNSLGNLYKVAYFNDAEKAYVESLKNRDKNDNVGLAQTNLSLGSLYRRNRNEKAEKYLLDSLKFEKLRKEDDDKYGIAITYNELGQLYFDKRELNKSKVNFELSIKFAKLILNENQKQRHLEMVTKNLEKLKVEFGGLI